MHVIEEMIVLTEKAEVEREEPILTDEFFKEMDKMVEENTMPMENALLLLKHMGYYKMLTELCCNGFCYSFLQKRVERMIDEEEKKKEEKNEQLLIDLCESYLLLFDIIISEKMIILCVPFLLKVVLKKEENEETQKEVEMALLALSNISKFNKMEKDLYLNEITEIIEYHQEHCHLTHLAYQSAWRFLVCRFLDEKGLEDLIVNELHFAGEAARELEEQAKIVDWKKKKMAKEEWFIFNGWIDSVSDYCFFQLEGKIDSAALVECLCRIHRLAQANYSEISIKCIRDFHSMLFKNVASVDELVKGGAIDAALEAAFQPTAGYYSMEMNIKFFRLFSSGPSTQPDGNEHWSTGEMKVNKRRLFEKLEEEGYEDFIVSCNYMLLQLNDSYGEYFSRNPSDYCVAC
ncbi:uncharacterized protein MONOS_3781 [Monocercomonoides exilis]|uniref:uncharacterized protein n=1 Tax=Monocercomonoides exilis TaxID=2049356 RepID=UPI00355A86DB|nr:hypothetical protein MONOS_3781 [Monocercomonoides exilis]|eukprot:MONOS_3781.1-p1 / transcript=MONOS_3781.1 / gene=MONOS_3781 / organism=Monocercomonoides_exilis_PA203 / gene_product=unspecified product / transcript_product=unspecified product / location=Mono_scaffold00092:76584-77855(+) / protein_length=404 / sequence_SO=supercontig / SO=protein_coding / is_pseudo=false